MKYVEITLRPSIEVPLSFLWKKIFMKVHMRLVELQDSRGTVPFGLSFPEYSENPLGIGSKLRIFARTEQELTTFELGSVLSNYTDYVHMTGIRNVPQSCAYAVYKRMQSNGNLQKIARRKAVREKIAYDEAFAKLKEPGSNKSSNKLFPYIQMKSLSSHQDFCLFVKREMASVCEAFFFSTYGLSATCSVPEFS